jgi:putative thioredoxin
MKPLFHEAAILLRSEIRAASVNVDEEPRLSEAFGIRGIPTLVLISGGKVIDSWSGVMPVGPLVERVRARLNLKGDQA